MMYVKIGIFIMEHIYENISMAQIRLNMVLSNITKAGVNVVES